jgi:hypothetical protein
VSFVAFCKGFAMLLFKGKFETPDSITGEVEFAPLVGERPSKHGSFKATRTQ